MFLLLVVLSQGQSAHSFAVESGRPLVALLIAEACVLRKLHSYDDDAHDHFVKHVKNGAYVNIQSHAGWTPLIYAAEKVHCNFVVLLFPMPPDTH